MESTPSIGLQVETHYGQVRIFDRLTVIRCESNATNDRQAIALGKSVATERELVDDGGRKVEAKCVSENGRDESIEHENESVADERQPENDDDPSVEIESQSTIRFGASTACNRASANGRSREVKDKKQSSACIVQSATSKIRECAWRDGGQKPRLTASRT